MTYPDWPGKNDDYPGPLIPNLKCLPKGFDFQGEIRSHLEEGYPEVAYGLLELYVGDDKDDLLFAAFQKAHRNGLLSDRLKLYGTGMYKSMGIWARQIEALPPDHPQSLYQDNRETHKFYWKYRKSKSIEAVMARLEFAWKHDLPLRSLQNSQGRTYPSNLLVWVNAYKSAMEDEDGTNMTRKFQKWWAIYSAARDMEEKYGFTPPS